MTDEMYKRAVVLHVAAILLGLVLVMTGLTFAEHDAAETNDAFQVLYERIDSLERRNFEKDGVIARLKNETEELQAIRADYRELKAEGWYPTKVLLYHLRSESRRWGIDYREVYSFLKTESSFWTNVDGPFGEVNGFQMLPSTARLYMVNKLGLDPSEFNIEDYKNVKTGTELAFLVWIDYRRILARRGIKMDWKNWNQGVPEETEPRKRG